MLEVARDAATPRPGWKHGPETEIRPVFRLTYKHRPWEVIWCCKWVPEDEDDPADDAERGAAERHDVDTSTPHHGHGHEHGQGHEHGHHGHGHEPFGYGPVGQRCASRAQQQLTWTRDKAFLRSMNPWKWLPESSPYTKAPFY